MNLKHRSAISTCLSLLALLGGVGHAAAQEPDSTPPTPQVSPTPAPPLIPGPPAHVRPDDKRRTLRSYAHNLGYNFLSPFQRDNRTPLLFSAALTASSFLLDDEWKQYFRDHPHENFGKIGQSIGGSVAVAAVTVGLFSAGRISRGDTFRAASYDLSQAVIVTQVYTQAMKHIVSRERPDKSNNLSFPSGHASNAFALASVGAHHYRKLAIPFYGLATYIAVSRMAADKHYFSDIVAGSSLGWGVGRAVARRNGRPPDPKPGTAGESPPARTSWRVLPWTGPSGDGQGLALLVTF